LTVDMPPPAAGSSLKMLAARYRDPEKSGLTIRAVLAKQNYNLDLTDVE
jgi:hypothetical protein